MNQSNLCLNQYIGAKTFHHWVIVKDVTTNETWASGNILWIGKGGRKRFENMKEVPRPTMQSMAKMVHSFSKPKSWQRH